MNLDGCAVVWCEGAFATPFGKTAHGLVRFTRRYRVAAVIDSTLAGQDAGSFLDGRAQGIPLVADLASAVAVAKAKGEPATHLVIGLAPDGGRLPPEGRSVVREALELGLNVDSGLHDFLSEDPELAEMARRHGVTLRDVRRTPPRSELHGFTGRIREVGSTRVALLGTDSAVGKRTTAWKLVDALVARGKSSEMIRTGQTGWLQGARYGILLDATINDFVAGELEHACVTCWDEVRPEYMVIEGQGSLLNPAYPGGLEILAATRASLIVLQHAPARREYDGFPGFPLEPIEEQIAALAAVSKARVVALTLNHEGLDAEAIEFHRRDLRERTGLPVADPLVHGMDEVVSAVLEAAGG
jgi:uncharacterized NAD-dependent epimerase/dehydratase family protein